MARKPSAPIGLSGSEPVTTIAPTEVYFQNIRTGELRGDPTNATTFADLNSPALAHRTCPGVQLMPNLAYDVYEGDGLGFAHSLRSIRARRRRQWSLSRTVRDAHATTADAGSTSYSPAVERRRDRVADCTQAG